MNQKSLLLFILIVVFALWLSPSSQVLSSTPNSFGDGIAVELPGGIPEQSSPTLADLTGDGIPEILVGTTAYNGVTSAHDEATRLVVMNGDGSMLWEKDTNAPINSSPAVGDINNDGQPEVVVSVGGVVADTQHQGGIIAYDRDGTQLWRFSTIDYNPVDGYGEGVYSSPTLCDVDNDNDYEIAFGGWDQRIYLLDHKGNSLWNNAPGGTTGQGYFNADSIWSTAACADLNDDGYQEIIIGADITGGGILPDGITTEDGGFLYIFDKDGNVLVRRFLTEAIFSSPAVGDLDGNGSLEIVTGTGWFWWNAHGRTDQMFVHAFDTSQVFEALHYADSAKLPSLSGWPKETPYPGYSSPALADLDGDNDLEVIIGTGDPFLENDGIPGAGSVYAWHHSGQVVSGWPITAQNWQGNDTYISSSPTVADIDNDGQLEILFSMLWDVQVYNANGTFQERLETTWTIWGSPAIGDADNDDQIEVWIAGGGNSQTGQDQSKGHLWKFEQTITGIGEMPWPQFHRDAKNSGLYPLPAVLSLPEQVNLYHDTDDGQFANATLILRNTGGLPFNFRLDAESERVEFPKTTGQIPAKSQVNWPITVNTKKLEGWNSLQNISIHDTDSDNTNTLPLNIYIGEISKIYLPFAARPMSQDEDNNNGLLYWNYSNYSLENGQITTSSPIIADLDGNGMDEIIVASSAQQCNNGNCSQDAPTHLTVTRHDGTLLWSQDTGGSVSSTPAVGDINRDGSLEVVVTVGTDPYEPGHAGRVIAYTAQGNMLWEFRPKDRFGNGTIDGIFSSPTLCDLNGDGYLQIIFGGLDGYVYALHSHGEVMWEYDNGWEIRSSAACADFNSDGRKEVVIGGMSDLNFNQIGGFLNILSSDGNLLVRRAVSEVVNSSPAIGDLDGNGSKEIVVGTSGTWWNESTNQPQPQAHAFDTSQIFSGLSSDDSAKLPELNGWPQDTDYPSDSSPSLADLDGNGDLEILLGTVHPTLNDDGALGAGSLYAWHHDGQLVNGWPITPKNLGGDNAPIRAAPVIADLDQNNELEVIFTMLWDVFVYNPDGSEQLYPTRTGYTLSGSPAVADTDDDNKIEIWVGGSNSNDQAHGYLWSFESNKEGFGNLAWPMFRYDASNTGAR